MVAAASGTVLIGGGAFWLSFVALADLAVRSGIVARQAWIWPLLVDGLIVVATVAVVALDGHRAAWYPWTLLIAGAGMSVTANAAHALVTAEASVPGVLAATVAAVPPLVLLASTHLTVVLTRPAPPAEQPPVQEAAVLSAEPREQTGDAQRLALPERSAPAVDAEPETPTARPPRPATALIPAVPTGPEPEPAHEISPEPDTSDEVSTRPAPAQDARPAPVSRAAGSVPDRRARAAALREAGWSNKQIARELGVHASTVSRWFPRPTGSSESETPMKEDKEKDHEPPRA
ncbi:DUF2637 domain-containing protein [Cumulibacter manganitolerans]|uniref:DUF2637 domain-containing protein n=1 Tax=Cumulibacter manganitolerans TaxID=1884992 RepID=UPI001296236B|nr:DUF2637 domain-containing protein [Cumulibacter manganitolerans]